MKTPTENVEWRSIPGLVGFQVSDTGDVRTLWTLGVNQHHLSTLGSEWRRVPTSPGNDYLMFNIPTVVLGRRDRMYVHHAVCLAFHGQPLPGQEARHLDGKRLNNTPLNLAWGTATENQADKIAHGTTNRGERCGAAKLTENDVREVRRLLAAGEIQRVIADRFGVHQMTISRIKRRKLWFCVPDDNSEGAAA
jgi:hypothetical protein